MGGSPERVLTVNAGSSSLKLRVLDADGRVVCSRDRGAIEDEDELRGELEAVLDEAPAIDAAGHRIVHGGVEFTGPTVLDTDTEGRLERLVDLAPLHNPPAVAAIRALHALRPELPAVACFDTAFHATMPAAASTYAIPAAWTDRWPLRRFGFHGLSHAYASRRAAELLGRPVSELRLVTAHLGAGASLAAVQSGRSVDTTMGFTPLEGLVMATRSGSVDPGLLLWVQRHGDLDAAEMERALDRESGLLALSGRSGDMREVLAGIDEGDERCHLAFDVYIHRLAAGIAAMTAAMGDINALVFTGGVGENSPQVRAAAVEAAAFVGISLNPTLNSEANPDAILSPASASAAVVLVAAREDLEIAAQVRSALGSV
ncbi:MAG TPA: acetate/propionate family kinase [Solirubrobacterales bacterium]|nr:acetate/propionate family kinase [Solirubrobacterales bacterium]